MLVNEEALAGSTATRKRVPVRNREPLPTDIYAQPTAVYRLRDERSVLLYVGVSNDPSARIGYEHATTKYWWRNVDPTKTIVQWFPDRIQALREELRVIRDENPVFNIEGRRSEGRLANRHLAGELADRLREDIFQGIYRPGDRIPSEAELQKSTGLARMTVRKATRILRAEGLLWTKEGSGTRVRLSGVMEVQLLSAGAVVVSRMPTLEERQEMGLGEGVPLLSVETPDGLVQVYPADRWKLVWPGPKDTPGH